MIFKPVFASISCSFPSRSTTIIRAIKTSVGCPVGIFKPRSVPEGAGARRAVSLVRAMLPGSGPNGQVKPAPQQAHIIVQPISSRSAASERRSARSQVMPSASPAEMSSSKSLLAHQPATSHKGSVTWAYSQSSKIRDAPLSIRFRVCRSLWQSTPAARGSSASVARRAIAPGFAELDRAHARSQARKRGTIDIQPVQRTDGAAGAGIGRA